MKGTSPSAWVCLAIVAVALTLLMAGTANAADYNLYFGDLHAHTNYSDGTGTPEDAYSAAYAAALLGEADFFATTDHNHCSYGDGWMTTANWADTLAAADAYNQPGVFVTLPGLRAVAAVDDGGRDEHPQRVRDLRPGWQPGRQRLQQRPQAWDVSTSFRACTTGWRPSERRRPVEPSRLLRRRQSRPISDWYDFGYYTPKRDQAVNMIEVWNEITYEPAYIRALDAGWHVLPHSQLRHPRSQLDHGLRCQDGPACGTPHKGLTWLAAMRASRGYATEDKNLEIRYTLGGKVMGSTLTPKSKLRGIDPDPRPKRRRGCRQARRDRRRTAARSWNGQGYLTAPT